MEDLPITTFVLQGCTSDDTRLFMIDWRSERMKEALISEVITDIRQFLSFSGEMQLFTEHNAKIDPAMHALALRVLPNNDRHGLPVLKYSSGAPTSTLQPSSALDGNPVAQDSLHNFGQNKNMLVRPRSSWNEEETKLRTKLAAAYRLFHLFGWTDLVYNHLTVRLPGTEHFLINPFGRSFDEITASNLVTIDLDGNIVDPGCLGNATRVNKAGYVIHSALHAGRSDVNCIMHCHENYSLAVACTKEGFIHKLNQNSMIIGEVASHEYEGIATREEERVRLVEHLGDKTVMFLKNHGILTCGATIDAAFTQMYNVIKCSKVQIMTLASVGKDQINVPSEESFKFTRQMIDRFPKELAGVMEFAALMRQLDRQDPSYRD